MKKVWVVSDTHFSHTNIIKYCQRPFHTAEEMNNKIRDNWNKVVGKEDIIIHLGDFGFVDAEFVDSLNGEIILIKGNHDTGKIKRLFNQMYKNIRLTMPCYTKVFFSHKPIQRGEFKQLAVDVNFHGHTHNHHMNYDGYVNHSVDVSDFTPVLLIDGYDKLLKVEFDIRR